MRTLMLPVKGVYYRQIKARIKPEEYRLITAYWIRRLVDETYDRIVVTHGYPKRTDNERRITLPWAGYQVRTISHPFFGRTPVSVFAIDVSGDPIECP